MEETEKLVFRARRRDKTGKGVARKLRKEKRLPAVLYGPNIDPVPLDMDTRGVLKVLRKASEEVRIWDLELEGEEPHKVIIRDVQIHPISLEPLHVDFYEVTYGQLLRLEVPIRIVGESVGVKHGGILEVLMDSVEIECYPKDLIEEIVVDISSLEEGDTLFVRDLPVGEEVRILEEMDQPVAIVSAPAVAEAEEGEEEEEEIEAEESEE